MLDETQKTTLIHSLEEKKKELDALRARLEALYIQKEEAFTSQQNIRKSIREFIAKVQDARKQRDALTQEVKLHKQKRDQIHTIIKQKLAQLKAVTGQSAETSSLSSSSSLSHAKTVVAAKPCSPEPLKKQIEELEMHIQVDAISFDKEQKVMKKIKELKKQVKECEEAYATWKKKHGLSAEIDELQQEAHLHHRVTQERAKQSYALHEKIIAQSDEIDQLRRKEAEGNTHFLELKSLYAVEQQTFKQRQDEMGGMRHQLNADKKEHHTWKEQQNKKTLAEKKRDVEEKLKKGKGVKITMEDLLAFQGMKE